MNAVTAVGMIAGASLILLVIFIGVKKHEISAAAVAVSLVGLILIGMSQWTTIKIRGGGVDIDLSTLQQQVAETATAVDALAEETVATAAVAENTRDQLVTLSNQLQRSSVVTGAFARTFRDSLAARPDVDTATIQAIRRDLGSVPRLQLRDTTGS